MKTLSTDLFFMVISYLSSPADLCHLRAVNKPLCELVTPLAFRKFNVGHTPGGCECLKLVLENPALRKHVEAFTFQQKERIDTNDLGESRDRVPDMRYALSRLHQLSSLTYLTVEFCHLPQKDQEHAGPEICLPAEIDFQFSILGAILTNGLLTAQSLTLDNLVPFPTHPNDSLESFREALRKPSSLTINVLTSLNRGERPWFPWVVSIPNNLLFPAQQNLTSLHLKSDCDVLFLHHPQYRIPPKKLLFPHLITLSLTGIAFRPGCCDVEFILDHHATLQKLELDSCSIQHPAWNPTTRRIVYSRWSYVWELLTEKMTQLVEFDIHQPATFCDSSGNPMKNRYTHEIQQYVDRGNYRWSLRTLTGDISRGEGDEAALERLLDTVEERRAARAIKAL